MFVIDVKQLIIFLCVLHCGYIARSNLNQSNNAEFSLQDFHKTYKLDTVFR